jgi:glycosyltransferase involved in cell wall biosynthesis
MKISIVIPVFNEEKTIEEIITRVEKTAFDKEIIVIDDGSNDRTREILRGLAAKRDGLTLITWERNVGKGAAIRAGLEKVTGDVVVIQDADLEYDPADYGLLLKPILENRADVVYGSRFVGTEPHRVLFFWHYLGNRFLTLLSNMLTNLNLTDMETGYKAYRTAAIRKFGLRENRFGFEPEITAKAAKMGCRIYEVGISYAGRTYAEGKKIRWWDGLLAVWCVIRYGLGTRKDG